MKLHKTIIAALVKADLIDAEATHGEALAALKAWAKAGGHTLPQDLASDEEAKKVVALLEAKPQPTATLETTDTLEAVQRNSGLDHADLVAMVRLSSLASDQQLELIAELSATEGLTNRQVLDAINARVQETAPRPGATSLRDVDVTAEARDKFHAAARDAILLAGLPGTPPERIYDRGRDEYVEWKPERRNYGLASPLSLATQCLIQAGYPANKVLNLGRHQIAKLVMGADPAECGLSGFFASSDGPAYNVSGMFPNILLDARNVALRASYDDARVTFDQWMGRGPDIPDFNDVHRIIAGEVNDPAAVPEDGEFEETTLSDGKESYRLTVWGRMLSFPWQSIVNDQLGAFISVEAKMGNAMRRKLNRLAYQVLKDNAALADNVALFSDATHNNLTEAALSDLDDYLAAFNTMKTKMKTQRGLDADSGVLNIDPQFVIYPAALWATISQFRQSTSVDDTNPGRRNIWQGMLTPIEDAELDAASGGSDTAFYLAASPMSVDTVEYAYLQGLPAPVVERADAFDRLAMRTRIWFAFGVKALDYRGLQKHTGEAGG